MWWRGPHTLNRHVGIVIENSSKPEMRRVHATSAISNRPAIMKHARRFFWNPSEVNNPTGPMCFYRPAIVLTQGNFTVTLSVKRSGPEPAVIGFLNEVPKALHKVCRKPVG